MNRWSNNGALDRVCEPVQREQIIRIKLEVLSIDSTVVRVHPDGTGALKRPELRGVGKPYRRRDRHSREVPPGAPPAIPKPSAEAPSAADPRESPPRHLTSGSARVSSRRTTWPASTRSETPPRKYGSCRWNRYSVRSPDWILRALTGSSPAARRARLPDGSEVRQTRSGPLPKSAQFSVAFDMDMNNHPEAQKTRPRTADLTRLATERETARLAARPTWPGPPSAEPSRNAAGRHGDTPPSVTAAPSGRDRRNRSSRLSPDRWQHPALVAAGPCRRPLRSRYPLPHPQLSTTS